MYMSYSLILFYITNIMIEEHDLKLGLDPKGIVLADQRNSRICHSYFSFRDCSRNSQSRTTWTRLNEYIIPCYDTTMCSKGDTVFYHWRITNDDTKRTTLYYQYKYNSYFTISRYLLDTGNFVISAGISVNISNDPCPDVISGDYLSHCPHCFFSIRPEIPMAVIKSGDEIWSAAGTKVTIDGSSSVNFNFPGNTNFKLDYKWECKVEPDNNFCSKNLGTKSYLEIPSSYTNNQLKYTITMSVKTIHVEWQSATQIVQIAENAVTIGINCVKNCKYGSNEISHRSTLFLEAVCLNRCKGITPTSYEWSMVPGPNNNKTSINFDTETIYGANTDKLVVKEYILSPGDNYNFKVNLKNGAVGSAFKMIELAALPKCETCNIMPTSGISTKTRFKIWCNNKDSSHLNYQIFQFSDEVNGLGILLGAQNNPTFNKVNLGPSTGENVRVFVKISNNKTGLYAECPLQASVKPLLSDKDPLEIKKETLKDYYDYVSGILGNSQNPQPYKATQFISSLIDEVSLLKDSANPTDQKVIKKLRSDIKLALLQDLLKIPTEDQKMLEQVNALAAKLSKKLPNGHDSVITKVHSCLCKKVAQSEEKMISKHLLATRNTDYIKNLNNNLIACVEGSTRPNITEVDRPPGIEGTSEVTNVVPEIVFTENYPDYIYFDEERQTRLENYEESTVNNIQTINLAGRALSHTLAISERQFEQYGNNVTIKVTIEKNKDLPTIQINLKYTNVTASKITPNNNDVIEIVVQEWQSNPFWWNQTKLNESTKVVDISVYDVLKNKQIVHFVEPMNICFNHKQKINLKWINSSVSVPKDIQQWKHIDYNITVHRIDVHKGSTLLVFFDKIENDINIVLKQARRPNFADFDRPILVPNSSASVMISFNETAKYGDTWFYVGILPALKEIRSKSNVTTTCTVTYSIAFLSPSCNYWDVQHKKWYRICQANLSLSKEIIICCKCTHLSSFIGIFIDAPNKVDNITDVNFTMELKTSWIVFIFISYAFIIYCLLLIYYSMNNQKESVYFLADNLKNERYAYLITVKTGNQFSAGTTSNVGIIVHGDQISSNPHILNYPDPEKRLLQRGNKDLFILTTTQHLGRIINLSLWLDFVGARPSWYVEYIIVHDLQTGIAWYFDIKTWLYILETITVIANPTKEENKNNMSISFLRKRLYVSNIAKVTLIFSTICLSMVLCLIFYHLPFMRLSDGFYVKRQYLKMFFIILICPILAYAVHTLYEVLFLIKFVTYNMKCRKAEYDSDLPWIVLSVTIVICMSILIVFGFFVPYVSGMYWITLFIVSVMLMCICFNFVHYRVMRLIAIKLRKSTFNFKTQTSILVKEAEEQRIKFLQRFGNYLLNWYFRRKYRMLDLDEIKKKQLKELARIELKVIYTDIAQFTFFLLLLFAFVLNNKNTISILSNKEMEAKLIDANHERLITFDDVANIDDFYIYVNYTLVPTVQSLKWYEGWYLNDPGLMADFNTKILGVVRIRQHRVPITLCDTMDYNEYWKRKTLEVEYVKKDQMWNYANKAEVEAAKTAGVMATYPGSGYICNLGRKIKNSHLILEYTETTKWIDGRTRALFIEFITFNIHSNTMNCITLLIETSATYYFAKSYYINTRYVLLLGWELDSISVVILMFVCAFVLITISCFKQLKKTKFYYFKETWNIVDMIIIILTLLCIAMHLFRLKVVQDFLDELQTSKHNEFVNYFLLSDYEANLIVLEACLICVSTVRLWKLLRFAVIFRIMESTVKFSAITLLGTLFYHVLFLEAFSLSGYLLFGSFINEFKDVSTSFTTLVILSVDLFGSFEHSKLRDALNGIGYCFSVTYTIFTLINISIYITVIMLAYYKSGQIVQTHFIYYTNKDLIKEEYSYFYNLLKVRRIRSKRLRAGTNTLYIPIAFPKENKYRYANSILIKDRKLFAMCLLAKSTLLVSSKQIIEPQFIDKIVFYLYELGKSCKDEIFFVADTQSETESKLINDRRLLDIEFFLNTLIKKNKSYSTVQDGHKQFRTKKFDNLTETLKMISSVINSIDVE